MLLRGSESCSPRADLAALAGGSQLPASTATVCPTTHPPAGDLAVAQVADYLVKNWPQDDSGDPTPTQAQLAPLLVDCNNANGEVSYPDENSVRVVTPDAQVNFGLAQVMGFNSTQVAAAATAEIKSPVLDTLPFYAFTGCDYGQQTISEPNNGHAPDAVLLSHPTESNAASLTTLTTSPASNPVKVPLNSTTTSLTISGTGLSAVTAVGFFESGNATSGPEPLVVDSTGFTISGGTAITVAAPLPAALTGVQSTWYVRVKVGTQWSEVKTGSGNNQTLKALPLSIGNPLLTCAQGSSGGNFGTLRLSNHTETGQWQTIAANIAGGLDSTLAAYPTPAHDWMCNPGASPAVGWPTRVPTAFRRNPAWHLMPLLRVSSTESGHILGYSRTLSRGRDARRTACPQRRSFSVRP